jgi:hypothetical protein
MVCPQVFRLDPKGLEAVVLETMAPHLLGAASTGLAGRHRNCAL